MKLLKTLAAVSLVSVISGTLAVACGGSSSNPPGPGQDSGTTTPADSGITPATDSAAPSQTDASDAAAFLCTGATCGAGKECCITQGGSSCIDQGTTCAGAAVACQNSTTCTTGDVCCGTFSVSSLTAVAACQAGPCASGAYQLCATSPECSNGETCQPVVYSGFTVPGIDACQAPASTDGGTDSGSTDASDDGG